MNYAWVSGGKSTGYRLHVESDRRTAEFSDLDGIWFTQYRAAQCLANAIKLFAKGIKCPSKS